MTGQALPYEHGHSHGLVDASIKRSREGLRAVGLSLAVLARSRLLLRRSSFSPAAASPCSPT